MAEQTQTQQQQQVLDPSLIAEILAYPGPFVSQEEQDECLRLVEELTVPEQETLARTSYAYWWYRHRHHTHPRQIIDRMTTTTDACPSLDDEQLRKRTAMKEARRHYVGEGRDFARALESLRNTCHYREEWKVDLMRLYFGNMKELVKEDYDKQTLSEYEAMIETELKRQGMSIRGRDRDNRPIVHREHRTSSECDGVSYPLAMIYIAERAFACVEIMTKGREEKVVAAFDYSQYESALAPPMEIIKKSITTLQRNYPERLKKLFILDPPFWLRTLYAIVSLFLSAETRDKLQMASGSYQKDEAISAVVDAEQATPFMLSDGKLSTNLDLHHFLYKVPFQSIYQET